MVGSLFQSYLLIFELMLDGVCSWIFHDKQFSKGKCFGVPILAYFSLLICFLFLAAHLFVFLLQFMVILHAKFFNNGFPFFLYGDLNLQSKGWRRRVLLVLPLAQDF